MQSGGVSPLLYPISPTLACQLPTAAEGEEHAGEKLYHAQLWIGGLHRDVLHVSGKAFVQPDVVPPHHSHQVPEPLHEGGIEGSVSGTWLESCVSVATKH